MDMSLADSVRRLEEEVSDSENARRQLQADYERKSEECEKYRQEVVRLNKLVEVLKADPTSALADAISKFGQTISRVEAVMDSMPNTLVAVRNDIFGALGKTSGILNKALRNLEDRK